MDILNKISEHKSKSAKAVVAIFSGSLFFLLFSTPAYAYDGGAWWWDVGGKISNMVCIWLLDLAEWVFNGYFELVTATTNVSYLSGTFSTLFGSESVYGLVETVHSAAVIPLAESILALFMLVQLVKISQRIDATATLPAVKDIVILAVAYVIFHWLIVNSLEIMAAIFDEFNKIVTSLQGNPAIQKLSVDFSSINLDDVTVGNCFVLVICGILSYFVGLVAYVISLLVSMARIIQAYVFAAFSALPVALLGFEETRQTGINFMKNFCALCLAGAIIMFLFISYPIIIASTVATVGSDAFNGIAQGATDQTPIYSLLTWLSMSILLCIGLVRSGAWAKEIIGS
ncbi:VirB6/TrbL-like conjugal transfer protein, CD1112 family [Arcanobacterium hippocoleae]|uniref:Conjugal transfer protein TrbL n=1 Tax=Arcanobacterium hippocoleae TaxID=149017 RepID=A0ABU1T1S9_9ACTO|nr:CD0415/CD1112 family protein [Arcanobacterium hippocoleae]MDR6939236.1 hypothetical protein [Arcanobacterium hippocoleae]